MDGWQLYKGQADRRPATGRDFGQIVLVDDGKQQGRLRFFGTVCSFESQLSSNFILVLLLFS
jgi:hypothetical protein